MRPIDYLVNLKSDLNTETALLELFEWDEAALNNFLKEADTVICALELEGEIIHTFEDFEKLFITNISKMLPENSINIFITILKRSLESYIERGVIDEV